MKKSLVFLGIIPIMLWAMPILNGHESIWVWTTSDACKNKIVFVNTTDVLVAVRAVRHACPRAHVASAQRTKWGGEDVVALKFTGACAVHVAGP
jgi:hypothetical protein